MGVLIGQTNSLSGFLPKCLVCWDHPSAVGRGEAIEPFSWLTVVSCVS